MLRREFIRLSGSALWASALHLRAEHRLMSDDPLVVAFDLSSLKGRYTETQDFFVRNHFRVPGNSPSSALRIEGEVENPQRLAARDLDRFSEREIGAVLECAGDPVSTLALVSDGRWTGCRLRDVLAAARPKREGAFAHLFGRDGFTRSVPLAHLLADGFLARGLNGRPLPPNHGAPWRALFPGWYGMDSVKWLERIVVARNPLPPVENTYLELRRSATGAVEPSALPPIQVKSLMTSPVDGAVLHKGSLDVRGVAWSGSGKIVRVEVSADAGASWRMARLDIPSGAYDWTLWRATVDARETGHVDLVCRAVDERGNVQPERRDPARADQYAYNVCHRIRCVVI